MKYTRRDFVKATAAAAAYAWLSPMSTASLFAEPVNRKKTLVVVFLRGGADGLNLCVPFGDPNYYKLRQSIAIAEPTKESEGERAIDLDGKFGLHPALSKLKPLFDEGIITAMQAVGYEGNSRSHFEEQDVWETGIAENTLSSDGWLNRHLATSKGRGELRAIAVGEQMPRILHGAAPAYAVRSLSDLKLPRIDGVDESQVKQAIQSAYCSKPQAERSQLYAMLAQQTQTTLNGIDEMKGIAHEYKPKADYPNNAFARQLTQVAQLIKSDVGLEVAEVDLGGWDTHNRQGGSEGQFANLARTLAGGVSAFMRDIEDHMDDVVLVTLSDFGRTAHENGTQGTDHGWGNCMFIAGGPVHRAKVEPVTGSWPGLDPDQLNDQRDLQHTTDFRDVLAELVSNHLGNTNTSHIFPGHEVKRVGVIG